MKDPTQAHKYIFGAFLVVDMGVVLYMAVANDEFSKPITALSPIFLIMLALFPLSVFAFGALWHKWPVTDTVANRTNFRVFLVVAAVFLLVSLFDLLLGPN